MVLWKLSIRLHLNSLHYLFLNQICDFVKDYYFIDFLFLFGLLWEALCFLYYLNRHFYFTFLTCCFYHLNLYFGYIMYDFIVIFHFLYFKLIIYLIFFLTSLFYLFTFYNEYLKTQFHYFNFL